MATKTKSDVKVDEIKANDAPAKESVYTTEEIIDGYKAFGAAKEIVTVAMKLSGRTSATFDEAKKIVDSFKNKEV